jgi:prepilin-type N-terminal cleavage/methylation domain-containing protein
MTGEGVHAMRGFTLAEVLITLGIIGVVATLTIPGLIGNYQKKQTVTSLKKAYSVLNQAFEMAEIEHGDYTRWTAADGRTYLYNELKGSQCTNVDSTYTQALAATMGVTSSSFSNSSCFQLADGMKIFHIISSTSSDIVSSSYILDINGNKGPNIRGRDIFSFYILYYVSDTFVNGSSGNNACTFKLNKTGMNPCGLNYANYCINAKDNGYFGRIMEDGWEIKDTYPW